MCISEFFFSGPSLIHRLLGTFEFSDYQTQALNNESKKPTSSKFCQGLGI